MFRIGLIVGVAFIGLIPQPSFAAEFTGCITPAGLIVKMQQGPDPKQPCSPQEMQITLNPGTR